MLTFGSNLLFMKPGYNSFYRVEIIVSTKDKDVLLLPPGVDDGVPGLGFPRVEQVLSTGSEPSCRKMKNETIYGISPYLYSNVQSLASMLFVAHYLV